MEKEKSSEMQNSMIFTGDIKCLSKGSHSIATLLTLPKVNVKILSMLFYWQEVRGVILHYFMSYHVIMS